MKDEVRLIRPTTPPGVFTDERGAFAESWHVGKGIRPAKCGLTSMNNKGALRGMHFQRTNPRALIVRCVYGVIWDVAVDIRKGSATYGQTSCNRLSAAGFESVHVPAGFAHGFYAMTDAVVIYECSELFDPDSHTGFLWTCPHMAAAWQGIAPANPIVSEKDAALPPFAEIEPIELS